MFVKKYLYLKSKERNMKLCKVLAMLVVVCGVSVVHAGRRGHGGQHSKQNAQQQQEKLNKKPQDSYGKRIGFNPRYRSGRC
jgi:hypothetical protein